MIVNSKKLIGALSPALTDCKHCSVGILGTIKRAASRTSLADISPQAEATVFSKQACNDLKNLKHKAV